MKKILAILCLLIMLAGLGCVGLSEYLTPAEIDREAVEYAVESGAADEKDYEGYPNLVKAKRLVDDVDAGHQIIQLDLQQQCEKDNLDYTLVRDVAMVNRNESIIREEQLFGEQGFLSLGMSLLGVGGFTGILGLMRKRPGDLTKEEADGLVFNAQSNIQELVDAKKKQFNQLVKGVDDFINSYKDIDPKVVASIKISMNKNQDTDTQVAVSAAKKGI